MALLTRDQIITARNAQIQKVAIESLGGDVFLRVVSLHENAEFTAKNTGLSGIDTTKLYASYLIANADGTRMFSDSEDDMQALGELSGKALMEIVDKGNALNGVEPDEVEETAKK